MKAAKATRENIRDLDRDQLLELCGSLIDSRNSLKGIWDTLEKDKILRHTILPKAALMMTDLAEKAGLSHLPEVTGMVEALGQGIHIQWAEFDGEPDPLPQDPENRPDPLSGDAEMVLGAKLHDLLVELTDNVNRVRMPEHVENALMELATTVDERLAAAISDGFKGIDGTPCVTLSHMPSDVVQISSIGEVREKLREMSTELEFGMIMLRLDLRGAMYRDILRRIDHLCHSLEDAATEEYRKYAAKSEGNPF